MTFLPRALMFFRNFSLFEYRWLNKPPVVLRIPVLDDQKEKEETISLLKE